jgi:hypothetical protein
MDGTHAYEIGAVFHIMQRFSVAGVGRHGDLANFEVGEVCEDEAVPFSRGAVRRAQVGGAVGVGVGVEVDGGWAEVVVGGEDAEEVWRGWIRE